MARERYVSTRIYAETWGVTPDTVRKWIKAELVTYHRVNKRVLRILDVPPGRPTANAA